MEPTASRAHPQHAIAVYAEPLASGARVAVMGDASLGLGDRLLQLGARSVQVWDPDEPRARAAAERVPEGVTVRPYVGDPREPRSVDLAVVPDLGLFDDAAELLVLVRRMVGEQGVAIVAATNRDVASRSASRAFDYYELFDLVAREFRAVRMVAQLPFRGIALVELGAEDESPAVSVDTQLADGDRAPEAFVALASQEDVRLEAYAIVELPAPSRSDDTDEPEVARAELVQAQLRAQVLQGQLEELRVRAAVTERAVQVVADLESALAQRGRQVAELSTEVEETRAAAEVSRIAAAEVDELARRADRAERRLAIFEQELSRSSEVHAEELVRVEEALRERAQAVRVLEEEVARREQMVRDLVGALDEAAHAVPAAPGPASGPPPVQEGGLADENARLRERLDALAHDLARREGEAQATAWTVAELERKLSQASLATPEVSAAPDASKLRAALDELDVLRRALAQEHEARLKAESGRQDGAAGAAGTVDRAD
jgi:hypothetical protein